MPKGIMKEDFYQYYPISISFDTSVKGDPVNVTASSVVAYDPDKIYLVQEMAKTKGNDVSYSLNEKYVQKDGKYTFMFKVRVKGIGDLLHIRVVEVKKSPVR